MRCFPSQGVAVDSQGSRGFFLPGASLQSPVCELVWGECSQGEKENIEHEHGSTAMLCS